MPSPYSFSVPHMSPGLLSRLCDDRPAAITSRVTDTQFQTLSSDGTAPKSFQAEAGPLMPNFIVEVNASHFQAIMQ